MQQSNPTQPAAPTAPAAPAAIMPTAPKKATIGFVLSLVGAVFILVQGVVRIFRGEALTFLGSDTIRLRVLSGLRVEAVGAIAMVFAIIILVGAYFIYHVGTETAGGIIVLIFAALSIITGGGWLIGFILGIIGGIMGLLKK
ncbi:MAG: hypothetical protein ABSA11_06540 [Candidatus Bathyarchaeia archaeon]